jgi:hypothetical protein
MLFLQFIVLPHNYLLRNCYLQHEPHKHRRPGLAEAIEVAKIYRGFLSYSRSNDILKKMGLHIDSKTFYNLREREQSKSMNPYEEACLYFVNSRLKTYMLLSKRSILLIEKGIRLTE